MVSAVCCWLILSVDDTDDDLKEFIPGPVGEETESEESESEDELAVPQIPRANDSKTLDATFSTVDDLGRCKANTSSPGSR